ncbi:MAG: lysophospholipid acyltransferase family protein [Oscillospiraceae bacterium]
MFRNIFVNTIRLIIKGVVNILFRIKVVGKENIPKKGNYIFCSNHISNLDPFVLFCFMKNNTLYLAKKEIFKSKILSPIFYYLGGVPIDRGNGDMETIEKCINEIKNGKSLLMYPEGTRSISGEMGRFKSGAIYLTKEAKADIVPIGVKKCAEKIGVFSKYEVSFGKVIKYEDLGLNTDDRRALRDAKIILQNTVKSLIEKEG